MDDLNVTQEPDVEPATFRIAFPLWTREPGASDRIIEFRLVEDYPNTLGTQILLLRRGTEELTSEELAAVVQAVRAVVEHDEGYLRQVGAYDLDRDPYYWTRDYGRWDQVDLVIPSGDLPKWIRYVARAFDGTGAAVGVEMWTKQEGRSDLTLELELESRSNGTIDVRFIELHVM